MIPLESPGTDDAPEGWWEAQHSGLDAEGEARVAALDAERAQKRMFRPGSQDDLAPSGARARFRANLEALKTLRAIQNDPVLPGRLARPDEQQVLARWGGWGAQGLWQVFDEDKPEFAADRAQLHQVLTDAEYDAARRTTINAHYTDPLIGREMWAAVQRLGFAGGRVLEPGCGTGTFIGLAPEGVQAVGVELDPTTAAITQALYPAADIRAESFADTRLPADTFDLTIGNVPFANVTLHDPRHNAGRHSMHNHFIIKSMGLTRPGGLVAVLTSPYTMDAHNPAARREMNELADLVGAVRLPTGAHRRAAGTEAVTDLLIFKRREPGVVPADRNWERSSPITLEGPSGAEEQVWVNEYWQTHPGHVLGEFSLQIGMYGQAGLEVHGQVDQLDVQLRRALTEISDNAVSHGQGLSARTEQQQVQAAAYAPAYGMTDGQVVAKPDGSFAVVDEGQLTPLSVPKTQAAEVTALLSLRDQARELIAAEAASLDDTAAIDSARAGLAADWQAYVDRYGPINRFAERNTGRQDAETGEPILARMKPRAVQLLKTDPWLPLVMALEVFDEQAQTAQPAGLLRHRLIVPRQPVRGVDNALDGLAVVLDTHGRVDLDAIAELMGTSRDQAISDLGDAVFQLPGEDERWVTRAEYLSGNVRTKLDQARLAAITEPGCWDGHVAALEAALPPDVLAGDISPRIGAVWIPDTDHEAFLQQLLGRSNLTVRRLAGSEWEVEYGDWGIQATQEWGTQRMPAGKLLERLAAQKPIVVNDTQSDGSVVFNPTETAAAVEKANQLQERFAEWVWEDPARSVRLVEAYNRTFNSVVLRDYTEEGKVLTLPGLAKDFVPREHQRGAVARMIAEKSVGLFHEVGAGKTAEMAIGCHELKRLGLVNKPAICVPNHMLDQFAREWLQLYPQARILAAGSDELKADQRKRFVARVATNDWDAVILTRTAFERLSLQPDHEAEFLDRQLDQTREALQRAKERGSSAGLRRAEKKLARREEALKAKRDMPRDPGISFEETGIDYLVIDELHEYKNLNTTSQITDANIDGSKRAMDLLAKVEYLRSTQGDRVITGATATPIANSVAEMHVMQRFLDPESLAEAGLSDFDSWAATFGEVTQNMELTVAGGNRFKVKTRLAKFTNVPELQTMFRRFADVKTAEDLDLPRPELAAREDGKRAPRIITVPRSEELASYIAQIGERADAIAARLVEPTEDNMLKLSSDGRKAALDMRLVDPAYGPVGSKIDAAADELARVWEQTRHLTYTEPGTGEVSATPGGLQLVFCDLGTPSQRWNVYDALKDALVARGLPAETIRFVHEAKTDTEKARLFEACRAGRVSVIVGSTSKMGVGTNIQNRAVHLMDLDAPWRPADVAQRHGRILRQGNQNAEIAITQVVTEGSFDTFMWQTLERKSRFIAQIMSGRNVGRETADIGEETLSFAEVKAISSGNPLLLELADAEQDLQRLMRLERSHGTSQRSLSAQLKQATARVAYIDKTVPELEAAALRTRSTKGDAFSITFCDGRTFTERAAAADHLESMITGRPRWTNPIATIAGHQVALAQDQFTYAKWRDRWSIVGAPDVSRDVLWSTEQPRTPLGTIARLENLPEQIGTRIERLTVERAECVRTISEAERLSDRPFKHADALDAARSRYATVTAAIADLQEQPTADAADMPESRRHARSRLAGAAAALARDGVLPDQQLADRVRTEAHER